MKPDADHSMPFYRQQIRQIAEAISEGVILIDVDQTIRWANAAALAMHGVDHASALGHTIDEYHANFQVKFGASPSTAPIPSVESVAAGKAQRDVIVEVTPLGGDRVKWVHRVRNLVLTNESGSPVCVLLVLHEVTMDLQIQGKEAALGQAIAAIQPQREHGLWADAEALCSMAPVPLHVLDADMRLRGVSNPWLNWLGYAREAVIGRRLVEFMTPPSALHFRSRVWEVPQGAAVLHEVECQLVKKSGTVVDAVVSTQVTVDEVGQLVRAIGALIDITERKQCEERFAKAFALAPVPMIIHRLHDCRILDANGAFLAATGHIAQAVIGHTIEEMRMLDSAALRRQLEGGLHATGQLRDIDVRVMTVAGDYLDCAMSADLIHAFGQPCALLALRDVTECRRNETQLFQAIERVMFSTSVVEKLAVLRSPASARHTPSEIKDLTRRERDVLGLISQGLTDTNIAGNLKLSRSTVRNHVASLYSKIDVHSRGEAIVWARERGINIAWRASASAPARRLSLEAPL